MAMSHERCDHPRTLAGRAACRKAGGPGGDPSKSTPPKGKRYQVRGPHGDNRADNHTRWTVVDTHDRNITVSKERRRSDAVGVARELNDKPTAVQLPVKASTPITVTPPTKRGPQASTHDLKRPGTQLRTDADLADVPHVFTRGIRRAWSQGWIVRVGDPYNELERRVELFSPRGVVSMVWRDANPNGLHGVFFRPSHSSITSRVSTMNGALRMALGEAE